MSQTLLKIQEKVKKTKKTIYNFNVIEKRGKIIKMVQHEPHTFVKISYTSFPGTCGTGILSNISHYSPQLAQKFALEIMEEYARKNRKSILIYLTATYQKETIHLLKENKWRQSTIQFMNKNSRHRNTIFYKNLYI